jgi:hypothetical protein
VANKARGTNRFPQFVDNVQNRAAGVMTQALMLGASDAVSLTPRDSSNLINGQYKDVQRDGTQIRGRVGYVAEYAAAVHAAKGKLKGQKRPKREGKDRGVFWGPSGEPHFLAKGFERAHPKITALLRGALAVAKVKP